MKDRAAKRILISATIIMSGFSAKAAIITCFFTEPFYTVTYTTGTRLLRVRNDTEHRDELIQDVGLLIVGSGKFELRTKEGQLLMTLKLTGNGRDGMSDRVYPYDARYEAKNSPLSGVRCGCESLKLKRQPEF